MAAGAEVEGASLGRASQRDAPRRLRRHRTRALVLLAAVPALLATTLAAGAGGEAPGPRREQALAVAVHSQAQGKTSSASATPVCGTMSPTGVTTVTVRSLGVSFVLQNFWVCVPGNGPLPADVALLERVDAAITNVVVPLRRATVGAFYLLPGGKIPCLLAVDGTGNGPLPTASAWQQEISDEAKINNTTVTGLHVTSLAVPAGTILEATFSQTEQGGAVIFVDEFLGDAGSRLIDAAFQGSPSSTVVSQAKQVMETLRRLGK
ncbi:MAG TPA: hypothetical protein VMD59_21000 [Acidimicrobiales bacterium]|nr:hypothetical protein [Acidimicrobiales bacterium]